jgi:class 3 adenylate cyclase/HEAT repeat protein
MKTQESAKPERVLSAILFADVKGYSSLSEHQLPVFALVALPGMADVLKNFHPSYVNTWGDAIVAAFRDPLSAARCAIGLRDYFRATNWAEKHLPKELNLRLALHAGVIFLGEDPIKGGQGLIGTQVNLAARVEPITRPGQIWATGQFVTLLSNCPDDTIEVDDLGERPLAKKWGSERLYRIRRKGDAKEEAGDDIADRQSVSFDYVDAAMRILNSAAKEKEKRQALELLGQTGESRAVPFLLEVAKDRSASVSMRNRAILSLGQLKAREAVPDLLDVLQDSEDDLDVRDSVVMVLGLIRDPRAGDVLLKVIGRQIQLPAASRGNAVSALGLIGESRYIPAVIQLGSEKDQEEEIYQRIIAFFSEVRDMRGIATLLSIAKEKANHLEQTRGAALEIAVKIAPELVVPDLIEITKDEAEVEGIRKVAIQGLGKVRTPKAIARLEEIGTEGGHRLAVLALAVLMNPKKYVTIDKDTDDE